ncbi:Terpenoid synthase [Ophiocordyceps sinensis CO18]|nr:Terpenoid synthase [Ophiocordyceps sinensis CO18]
MPSVSSETSVIKVTQWFHSERLDENLWRDDPRYLFCIPPRISKYATTADDAAIQCQIDIAGIKNIGFFDGSLSTIGGFTALVHPETLPERVAAVSYLTEFLGYYDDIESPEPDEISIEPSQFSVRKQLSIQDSAWKLRSKTAFSKALSSIHDIDPILGGEVLQAWQDWRLADKHLNDHFDEYKGLDEYLQDRIIDLAWG